MLIAVIDGCQISGKDPVDPVADITGMIQILDIFRDRGSILCLLGISKGALYTVPP